MQTLRFVSYEGSGNAQFNLIFFPIVIDCIENNFECEQKIWLILSFIVRACILPNCEYASIDTEVISDYAIQFYNLYEQSFGSKQCSYSIHVISCHLLQIRGKNPLTFTSAFPYENFYSEMKNSYQSGTKSTLKQIFSNVLMKRLVEYHVCESSLYFKPDKKSKNGEIVKHPRECNDLLYTFQSNEYQLYKLIDIVNDELFSCVQIGTFPAHFSSAPHMNWNDVGVFRAGPLSTHTVEFLCVTFLENSFVLENSL